MKYVGNNCVPTKNGTQNEQQTNAFSENLHHRGVPTFVSSCGNPSSPGRGASRSALPERVLAISDVELTDRRDDPIDLGVSELGGGGQPEAVFAHQIAHRMFTRNLVSLLFVDRPVHDP